MAEIEPGSYTYKEAAQRLNVSVATVRRLIGQGRIRTLNYGPVRLLRDDVESLLDPPKSPTDGQGAKATVAA